MEGVGGAGGGGGAVIPVCLCQGRRNRMGIHSAYTIYTTYVCTHTTCAFTILRHIYKVYIHTLHLMMHYHGSVHNQNYCSESHHNQISTRYHRSGIWKHALSLKHHYQKDCWGKAIVGMNGI